MTGPNKPNLSAEKQFTEYRERDEDLQREFARIEALSAPSGSCDEGVACHRAARKWLLGVGHTEDRQTAFEAGWNARAALSTSSSTLTPDADEEWLADAGNDVVAVDAATPAIRNQAFEEAARAAEAIEWSTGPETTEAITQAIRALKGTPSCAHSFVDHPCPSPEQEDKRYCELCGESEPAPSPDLLKELVEALETILCCHDGNQPAALNMPDLDYARRVIREIHSIARAALLKARPGDTK